MRYKLRQIAREEEENRRGNHIEKDSERY